MGYIDTLKKKGTSKIEVAQPRVSNLIKQQENKCADCKKALRPGYFKSITDESKWKTKIVCSDCLVKLVKKN